MSKPKAPKKFTHRKSGEWVQPRMKSYFLQKPEERQASQIEFPQKADVTVVAVSRM